MSEKTTRCSDCAGEFSDEEIDKVSRCPTCGTTSVPCAIAEDVTLKINWHELRILTIWASNYADQQMKDQPGQRTLKSIIKRLHAQYPEKAPLTLADEFQQLANRFGDVEVVRDDGTSDKIKQNKPS